MGLLDELAIYRSNPSQGGMALTHVELLGGKPVLMSNVDVDPMTFKEEYYYNTRRNILYRKVGAPVVGCRANQIKVWKPITSWSSD